MVYRARNPENSFESSAWNLISRVLPGYSMVRGGLFSLPLSSPQNLKIQWKETDACILISCNFFAYQMFSAKSGLIIVEAILSCLPSAPYVWSTKKYFQPVKVACGVILYLEVLHYKCYPWSNWSLKYEALIDTTEYSWNSINKLPYQYRC